MIYFSETNSYRLVVKKVDNGTYDGLYAFQLYEKHHTSQSVKYELIVDDRVPAGTHFHYSGAPELLKYHIDEYDLADLLHTLIPLNKEEEKLLHIILKSFDTIHNQGKEEAFKWPPLFY